jgi:hypothetical protein
MKENIFAFLFMIFSIFGFIFIRSYFIEKADFENKLEGILKDKKITPRGFYDLYVYDSKLDKIKKQNYYNLSTFDKIQVGDSILKKNNSWYIQVYRNSGKGYQFLDSFNVGRW